MHAKVVCKYFNTRQVNTQLCRNLAFDLTMSTVNISILESEPVNSRIGMVAAFEVGGDGTTTFIRYRILEIDPLVDPPPVEVTPPFRINSAELTVNNPDPLKYT